MAAGSRGRLTGYRATAVSLTHVQLRNAKPGDKPYKLADEKGLHLLVKPTGSRLWRYRYEWGGKEKALALGQYPEVSLAEAREARDAARGVIRSGKDPAVVERQAKLAQIQGSAETFEALAREWHDLHQTKWSSVHAVDVLRSLENDVFVDLGGLPIRQITAPEVLATLRKIEKRGAFETAHRIRQSMSAVFVFAIASGRGEADPAAIVAGALAPIRRGRLPALTDLDEVRTMMADVEALPAYPVTKLGLRFLALTAVRSDTRTVRWRESEVQQWMDELVRRVRTGLPRSLQQTNPFTSRFP